MDYIKLNELRLELGNLELLAYKCDRIREEIWNEYKNLALNGDAHQDRDMVYEKTKQLEWQFSHVRDNVRMAKEMLAIIEKDYKKANHGIY